MKVFTLLSDASGLLIRGHLGSYSRILPESGIKGDDDVLVNKFLFCQLVNN